MIRRFVVQERRAVAELLAGGELGLPALGLVDEQLRAIAVAVLALRAMGEPPIDEYVIAIASSLGKSVTPADLEMLRREGFRRAA